MPPSPEDFRDAFCVAAGAFGRPCDGRLFKYNFGAQDYENISGLPCHTVGPPSDCLDTVMDRFCGDRPVSLPAVFPRRSRHGRYMMAAITTVRQNALLHAFPLQLRLCGAQKRSKSICGVQKRRFRASLTTTTVFVSDGSLRISVFFQS